MTYMQDGTEYLDLREWRVYCAIERLQGQGRSVNNSQVAAACGLSRTMTADITAHLSGRGYIRDISSRDHGAYRWRLVPAKPAKRYPVIRQDGNMRVREHLGYGHGLPAGVDYDLNCLSCRRERGMSPCSTAS